LVRICKSNWWHLRIVGPYVLVDIKAQQKEKKNDHMLHSQTFEYEKWLEN
jgi:hypothetical protein